MTTPQDILDFWFSERVKPLWFKKDPAFDEEIREKFLSIYEDIKEGKLPEWEQSAEGLLAIVIVLDQFSRNMFRDTPEAFATDELALNTASYAISNMRDNDLTEEQRAVLYMPFMHSESATKQAESVALFEGLDRKMNLKYAIAHKDIIDRFGRFPHRNKILGRENTPEEEEFLTQPGSSF